MSIKINIHKTHRQFTNGLDILEVDGSTVGACLDNLIGQFPDMKKVLFDKKGELLNVIEIYINQKSAYPNELARPVKNGDNIYITLMIAGG
ncbi:MAG: MoaD/ThiS family protein [Deltaproteobacteria bacterium]|nr:MoaD/ThiS family protein [Deltaproteobacteria bacterium]NNK86240.1 ThiS family protein [Desulfobacterales bacterium]